MAYNYTPGKVHLMLTQAVKEAVMNGKEWKHGIYTIRKCRRKKDNVYYGFDLLVHDHVIAFVVPSVCDDSIVAVYVTTEPIPKKVHCDVLNDVFTALGMGAPFTWVEGTKNRYPYIYDTSFIKEGNSVCSGLVPYSKFTSYTCEPKF